MIRFQAERASMKEVEGGGAVFVVPVLGRGGLQKEIESLAGEVNCARV